MAVNKDAELIKNTLALPITHKSTARKYGIGIAIGIAIEK